MREMDGLIFDAENHEYRVNGIVYPSVTQIMTGIGLYDLSHVPERVLRESAERGTIVHLLIEWHEKGILDERSIDPELRGYFDSYLRMKDAKLLPDHPSAIEEQLYSEKYGYAGTLDQMYEDDWINDLKTGVPDPGHSIQLSAYWLLKYGDITKKPRSLTCSYLHADGSCGDLVRYDCEMLTWVSMVVDYKWRAKNGKLKMRGGRK